MVNEDNLKHILLDLISTARPVSETRLRMVSDVDWQSLCVTAKQHRVGPMLHHRIQSLDLGEAIPPNVLDQWSTAYRKAAFRYLSFRKTLARLNDILETEHITFATLKGAWLSQYAYEDPALRPLRDIDILVEPETALTVSALLEKNGFVRHPDFPVPVGSAFDLEKHLPPMCCPDTGILVEVHTRLMHTPPRRSSKNTLGDVTALLASREFRDGVPYLTPTDILLHLIVHAAYDHQFNNGPLTFTDIAFLLERSPIDWPRFWTMAEAGDWVRGCILILELASYYHNSNAWREFYEGTIPSPSIQQQESAALLSLQDFDQRGVIAFKARVADASARFSILNRLFPPLHTLAAFSGASKASYWSLLHYPHWLVAQIHKLFFAMKDAGMLQDIDRAKSVRNWMYSETSL